MKRLTLGKLRSATSCFETVLFTLFHSRVAGQEACGLQGCAVALIDEEQCACDTVTDSAGLAGNAAAVDGSLDVDLADGAGGDQGLTNDELQSLEAEVIVDITAVDGDSTGAVGDEVDACYRLLAIFSSSY